MKVLVVSVVHTPFDARIHHRQIRALRAADVEVTQVAPWAATGLVPTDGVDGVVGVDVPRAQGRHRMRAVVAARHVIRELGPDHDVILLHDPELILAVVGRLRRLPPVVLDVHEDMGASLQDRAWIPAPLRGIVVRIVHRLERWSERHLASLLLAEEGYRDRFRRDHPVVPNLPWRSTVPDTPVDPAPVVDPSYVDPSHVDPSHVDPSHVDPSHVDPDHADPGHVDPGRVVYVGRISTGRGVHELIAIADQLAATDGPRLELVGPADADVAPLLRAAVERGLLRWHGFLPNDEAMHVVQGALAGLAPLHDLPNYRISMPTKVVEYLANGVPAIVTPLPPAVQLVEAAGAGYVVPFGDVTETVAAILELAARPEHRARLGAAGRAHVEATHSWDAAAAPFVAHLRELASSAGQRP